MNYDYQFFEKHAQRNRLLKAPTVHYICNPIIDLYDVERASKLYKIVSRPKDFDDDTPSIVRCNGAYYKGGQDILPLESSLRTKLPEDFVQFYEAFGECVIITRTEPVRIYSLQQMIDDFEDDPDIRIKEGRFFRFACYDDPLYLGLRRNDVTDAWVVVICTYGLLYSEMIGPQGRGSVVAPSFYEWLRHLIETDGYPDKIYPRDPDAPYLTVIQES